MKNIYRKRPKFGDVIEIQTPKGLAYAQYTHKHIKPPRFGALLRILPGLYQTRPTSFSELVQHPERFSIFFPLGSAVWRGLVHIVGHEEIPKDKQIFPIMRASGGRDRSGKIHGWWICDGEKEWRVDELTPDQRKLSIQSTCNLLFLVDRIASGWSPEDEI